MWVRRGFECNRDSSSTFFWIGIDLVDDGQQISSVCLFHNPKYPVLAGVLLKHVVVVRGMQQNFGAWQTMRDQSSRAEPAHSGHTEVKDHDVGLAGLCLFERLVTIARALANEIRIRPLQKFAEPTAYSLVVINDEDFHRVLPLRQNCSSSSLRYLCGFF